jgi:hypothetical protein
MFRRRPWFKVSNWSRFASIRTYLGGGVVLWLGVASNQRPLLVRIDKLCSSTKDDTGRAGIYESLDSGILRRLQQVLGALNVDLVVDRRRQVEVGRSCVDDGVRLNSGEELLHGREIGNVAIVIGDSAARVTIRVGAQVEHCDLGLGMALDDVADNMAAEEAATTDDHNRTESLES